MFLFEMTFVLYIGYIATHDGLSQFGSLAMGLIHSQAASHDSPVL